MLTAEFEPFQEVDVMAKVSGYIREIKVDIGDRVQEGQLLATLEIPEMQDDLTRAAAAIERPTPNWPRRAMNCSAPSRRMTWRTSLIRAFWMSPRSEKGLVPQQEVDEAHSRDLVAEAQVSAAKSHIAACEQRIRVAQAEQARVKTLYQYAAHHRAIYRRRHQALRQHGLADPGRHGVADAGHAGGPPFANSLLRLRLPVPESAVPLVRLGEPVDVQSLRADIEPSPGEWRASPTRWTNPRAP